MATRNKHTSPTLTPTITEDQWAAAVRSKSGGCLIADAITKQYPNLSRVSVDMATIRATDAAAGVRYIYLTPQSAQMMLLSFDQGWTEPELRRLTIRRAVQIIPISRAKNGPASKAGVAAKRRERIAALEAKQAAGHVLTKPERISLTSSKAREAAPEPPDRPSTRGPAEVADGGERRAATVYGGQTPRIPDKGKHPNLLAGTDRQFGAKLADPGLAFKEAVEKAVAAELEAQSGNQGKR